MKFKKKTDTSLGQIQTHTPNEIQYVLKFMKVDLKCKIGKWIRQSKVSYILKTANGQSTYTRKKIQVGHLFRKRLLLF